MCVLLHAPVLKQIFIYLYDQVCSLNKQDLWLLQYFIDTNVHIDVGIQLNVGNNFLDTNVHIDLGIQMTVDRLWNGLHNTFISNMCDQVI